MYKRIDKLMLIMVKKLSEIEELKIKDNKNAFSQIKKIEKSIYPKL